MAHGHDHGYTSINTPGQTREFWESPMSKREGIFSRRQSSFVCWGPGGQCRKSYAGAQETSPSPLFLSLKVRRQRTKEDKTAYTHSYIFLFLFHNH